MRFAIKQNTPLTSCVYRMVLQGDTSAITAPGQFVQVQVPGFYLRRPTLLFQQTERGRRQLLTPK